MKVKKYLSRAKKVIFLSVAFIILAAVLTACLGGGATITLRPNWQAHPQTMRFDVFQITRVDGNEQIRLIPDAYKQITIEQHTPTRFSFLGRDGTAMGSSTGHLFTTRTSFTVELEQEGQAEGEPKTQEVLINTRVLFAIGTSLSPIFSYREVYVDGELNHAKEARYDGNRYHYRVFQSGEDGEIVERGGDFRVSGAVFSNEMILALLRAMPGVAGRQSMSISVPWALDSARTTLSVSLTALDAANSTTAAQGFIDKLTALNATNQTYGLTHVYNYGAAGGHTMHIGMARTSFDAGVAATAESPFAPVFIRQGNIAFIMREAIG